MKREVFDRNIDLLMDISVPVQIRFGRIRMQLDRLLDLKEGTVVELDQEVDGDVDVIVNNRVIARGELVEFEGEYGVRIRTLEKSVQTASVGSEIREETA